MDGARILIVDDEANVRETMCIALETVGYRVETAADGPQGVEKFGNGEAWDLVLLDQRMPGMEGLEVLSNLRERDPDSRVVMVTAYGTIELAVEAMKAGAVDFLRKPFTPQVLRGAVQATLAHPRGAVRPDSHSLTHLLPGLPSTPQAPSVPLIHFRTLNGYKFWPVPLSEGEAETEALRIRRDFEAQAPEGKTRRCAVEITTSVRGKVRDGTGRDFAPEEPVWDAVARSGLAAYLWERAELPPDSLSIFSLSREQLQIVCSFAGIYPPR